MRRSFSAASASSRSRSMAVNDDRTTSGRATLLIEPTQHLTIKPALLWQSFSTNGTDAFDLALPRYQQQKLTEIGRASCRERVC